MVLLMLDLKRLTQTGLAKQLQGAFHDVCDTHTHVQRVGKLLHLVSMNHSLPTPSYDLLSMDYSDLMVNLKMKKNTGCIHRVAIYSLPMPSLSIASCAL